MPDERENLFSPPNTHASAQQASARASGHWREKILARLGERPSAIFELAAHFEVSDNRLSGRISDLSRDLYIEPTGEIRINPATNCKAEVWRIRREGQPIEQLRDRAFPLTIRIDSDLYDRQAPLKQEAYPGVPYARRADTGGLRAAIRVELIECPGCGQPLYARQTAGKPDFACGNQACGRVFKCRTITEPGKAPMLALVMETM